MVYIFFMNDVCYIWVIGATRSGKSALMCRWYGGCIRNPPDEYPGCYLGDGVRRGILVDGKQAIAEFYEFETETPSEEELASFKMSNVILITYSIDCKKSFEEISKHLLFIEQNISGSHVKFIVGCKCENETSRVVTTEQGKLYAASTNCHFMEVSAHANINEIKILEEIIRQARLIFPLLLTNSTKTPRCSCM